MSDAKTTMGDALRTIETPETVLETFSVRKSHLWYAFSSDLIPNATKIGDTTRNVPTRIEEWRSEFPDATVLDSGDLEVLPGVFVRDHAIHRGCRARGYHSLQAHEFADGIRHTTEAYDVAPADASALVHEVLEDIRARHGSPDSPYEYYSVDADRKELGLSHYPRDPFAWELRPMQRKTVDSIRSLVAEGKDDLLVDASVRFGKTFTALSAAAELGATRILVTSGKTDVESEWQKATEMPGQFGGWVFVSPDMLRASDDVIGEVEKGAKVVVAFMTLQDSYNADEKLRYRQVLSRKWDVTIVDETHFGVRAERYGQALAHIETSVTLHLSGTPYRILADGEYADGRIAACYTRTDMLEARDAWYEENAEAIGRGDLHPSQNPYFGLPTPVTFALRDDEASMARIEALSKDGISVDLGELFAVGEDGEATFAHEDEVRLFLKMIDGEDETMGFLAYDVAKRNGLFGHMLACLPRKRSCDALESLIRRMSDEGELVRLCEYEVLNVAGEDPDEELSKVPLAVRRISDLAREGRKTLTLTVNMMLTGVTVPEWDTILMLKGTRSAEQYEQATGRLLSAWVETVKNEGDASDSYKVDRKPYVVIVDFDPRRVFQVAEERSIAQRLAGHGIDEAVERDVRYRRCGVSAPRLA